MSFDRIKPKPEIAIGTYRLIARYIFAWFVFKNALSNQLPTPSPPFPGSTANGT
jgi:hypothetical protein